MMRNFPQKQPKTFDVDTVQEGEFKMDGICGIVVVWVVCGLIAGYIYQNKGRSSATGFLGGFLLGPLGIILALVTTSDKSAIEKKQKQEEEGKLSRGEVRKCPYCAEIIKREAIVCKHCGRDLPTVTINEEINMGDPNENALEKFIKEVNQVNLDKPAEQYLSEGIAFSEKLEFDDAIAGFVKVIKVSTPDDESYQIAKRELNKMGFSESDIKLININ